MDNIVALPSNLGGDEGKHLAITALLRARRLAGLDQDRFARLLAITPGRLRAWEAGEEPLPATALLQAATVAGVPIEVLLGRRSIVRRLEELEHRVQELVTAFGDPRVLARRLEAVLEGWPFEDQRYDEDEVRRREFLALMLLTLGGASAQALDIERLVKVVTSGRLDKAGLDDLRSVTREYSRRGEMVSPPELLQAARVHLNLLTGLLSTVSSPPLRRELQIIAGETAVLAGGLSFRVESWAQAEACYPFARYLAGEAGDQELGAYALARQSSLPSVPAATGTPYVATSFGAEAAVALLDEAEPGARSSTTPHLHSAILVRRAEEHAARGEDTAAYRDLGLAARSAANDQYAEDRFFAARFRVARYEGLCATLLGRREGASILEASLADTPSAMVSERCGQLADLGAAWEVEAACARLGEALPIAIEGGHAMRVRRIRAIRQRYLAPWTAEPVVKDLDRRLTGALAG